MLSAWGCPVPAAAPGPRRDSPILWLDDLWTRWRPPSSQALPAGGLTGQGFWVVGAGGCRQIRSAGPKGTGWAGLASEREPSHFSLRTWLKVVRESASWKPGEGDGGRRPGEDGREAPRLRGVRGVGGRGWSLRCGVIADFEEGHPSLSSFAKLPWPLCGMWPPGSKSRSEAAGWEPVQRSSLRGWCPWRGEGRHGAEEWLGPGRILWSSECRPGQFSALSFPAGPVWIWVWGEPDVADRRVTTVPRSSFWGLRVYVCERERQTDVAVQASG